MLTSRTMGHFGPEVLSQWTLETNLRHLNHASFGGVPRSVQEHRRSLVERMEANPVRWFVELPGRVREARERVAEQLGVPAGTAAFVQNATAGASVVYRAHDNHGPVDVAVTSHGYGAVVMGAARLARETGGALSTIDIPLAATDDEVVSLVDAHLQHHHVDLLVVDQVTSSTARAFPADRISQVAHRHGARVLVDGAHSPGVLVAPVVREADYWVGNLHKFWCAPRGAAVLVENIPGPSLFPLIDSWGGADPFPERFDVQGTIDATAWLSAPAAYDDIESEFGWAAVREHSAAMMDLAEQLVGDALKDVGVSDPVPDVGHATGPMRLFRMPGDRAWTHDEVDALRVPFLEATGIVCAFTNLGSDGFIRLSSHAYTTAADIEAMADRGVSHLARGDERTPHERLDR